MKQPTLTDRPAHTAHVRTVTDGAAPGEASRGRSACGKASWRLFWVVGAAVALAVRIYASRDRGAPVRRLPATAAATASPAAASAATASPAARRRRLLIAHEQHLQRVGSDTRLLALITTLRQLDTEVSLLVRTGRCNNCTRSPPTRSLARMLGAQILDVVPLSSAAPVQPPAIYEFGGTSPLAALLAAHPFDMVIIGLWFWYDPQPSFAELILPVVRAHAHASIHSSVGAPLVTLLSDDAHSERALRLSEEEPDPRRSSAYRTQAINLAARMRALFAAVDGVFYLTPMDRDADARLLPRRRPAAPVHVALLRMAVAPAEVSPSSAAAASGSSAVSRLSDGSGGGPMLGFVGDGHTPTNVLGVRRFLRDGWPLLRRAWPSARLRIVGRVPTGHRPGRREARGGKDAPCNATAATGGGQCGWAAHTQCAARPSSCGIDSLGYLSDAQLRSEASEWRLMLAPIFATTGANTKLLLGLQLGLPIVSTRAAAAPFGLAGGEEQAWSGGGDGGADGDDDSYGDDEGEEGGGAEGDRRAAAAAVGSTPQQLAHLASSLLSDRAAASRLAANGRAHLLRLASSRAPTADVHAMLRWVAEQRAQLEQQTSDARLLPSSEGGSDARATPLVVGSTCGLAGVWPGGWRVEAVWQAFCRQSGLTCVRVYSTRAVGEQVKAAAAQAQAMAQAVAAGNRVVLLDRECQLRAEASPLVGASLRFVLYAWDPANARQLYHWHGGVLRSVIESEKLAASMERSGGVTIRVDRLGSARAWRAAWRTAFAVALGLPTEHTSHRDTRLDSVANGTGSLSGGPQPAHDAMLERLVHTVAEPHRAVFTRELRAHVQRPRWPKRALVGLANASERSRRS